MSDVELVVTAYRRWPAASSTDKEPIKRAAAAIRKRYKSDHDLDRHAAELLWYACAFQPRLLFPT